MPKRPYPDYDIVQPVKKQQNSLSKSRKIRSSSSERTLQLLYKGASKREKNEEPHSLMCTVCSKEAPSGVICNYCEHALCLQCTNMCHKCSNGFCNDCSFPTYDHNVAVCYSCYS
ncbi:uncharacterized protein LOC103314773 [Tribolium castaneum]|uniref:Uncharacterized protein n=1 Tax=Tribolium castaneum TaxID=7070 RepID=A0A139WP89_TRICA|nr:PREDICTED: uncharacterized protein LOC103314773 [Tribolium castaneum]KYB29677.1 hypothetical protein TcasGA2_TC034214 [Tribolium castaneum]|eukprot:XP_008199837.1 PREDICTED: uncharacterized protein LOC103314773 [Tribolium castaneum]